MKAARGVAIVLALGASACSVLLDWNLAGDVGDGGATSDASSSDAPSDAAASCTGDNACVTAAPSGWAGPIALFEGPSSQATASCGAGFDATPIFDGHADLTASPPTCSACACGAAANVSCTGPVLTFFKEDTCSTPCGSPVTLDSACVPTDPTCRGVVAGSPSPAGGACPPSGGVATKAPPAWGRVARACAPATTPSGAGCATGQVCAPPPAAPFSTHRCVMQPGAATACPVEYPVGPRVYYGDVADTRGCSPCACTTPSGGHCASGSPAGGRYIGFPCVARTGSLAAPAACASFNGGESVTVVTPPTLDDAGACTPSGGAPRGDARPATPMSFCCAL